MPTNEKTLLDAINAANVVLDPASVAAEDTRVAFNRFVDALTTYVAAPTIPDGAVTLAKMANMATASLIYRKTAATGVPEVTSLATLKTDLGLTGTNTGTKIASATMVVGAEGGDTINVAVQLKDPEAVDLAVRGRVLAYLSNDANGDSLATNAPSGGCAIGTDGLLIPVTPALTNALLVDGNLAIDSVPEKFKTGQTAAFLVNGVLRTKAVTTALTFTAAHVITASKFGVILVQINAAGTISTKVPASPQAYDDAPTALAALPAVDAGNVSLGYIAIANNVGDWTANTDDLTDGSDVTTAAFSDSAETSIGAAKAFELTSEADGDIDINIVEAGVATWYLVIVLPNGLLNVSGAITFA